MAWQASKMLFSLSVATPLSDELETDIFFPSCPVMVMELSLQAAAQDWFMQSIRPFRTTMTWLEFKEQFLRVFLPLFYLTVLQVAADALSEE